ncbi:unnamed protein product [Acidithrix sp. C25]|nr:unnamed protein product [Acidithrix sp. C25]
MLADERQVEVLVESVSRTSTVTLQRPDLLAGQCGSSDLTVARGQRFF